MKSKRFTVQVEIRTTHVLSARRRFFKLLQRLRRFRNMTVVKHSCQKQQNVRKRKAVQA